MLRLIKQNKFIIRLWVITFLIQYCLQNPTTSDIGKEGIENSRIPKKLLQKLAYHIKINKNSKIIINSLFRTNC